MLLAPTTPLGALTRDMSFDGTVRADEPLRRHTTYRIGGNAAAWVECDSLGALSRALDACAAQDVPWTVIGKGSNLLVSDAGFPGAVIVLGRDFRKWNFDAQAGEFTAGAAVALSRIVQEAFHQGVSGLEFAVGTPGSVGGALRMNAGTRNEGLGDHVVSVTTFARGRGLVRYLARDIAWGYRRSSLSDQEVVVECTIAVKPSEEAFIRAKMEGALARRKRTQPMERPSCGSVFRNPEGASAGALIEGAGLSGYRVGGAQVSNKHANFIVNTGGATAADVAAVIAYVQQKVKQVYGIELKTEVRFLGFEG